MIASQTYVLQHICCCCMLVVGQSRVWVSVNNKVLLLQNTSLHPALHHTLLPRHILIWHLLFSIYLNTIVLAQLPVPHDHITDSGGAGVCVYKTLCPPEAVWRHPDCCPAIYAIFIPPPAANCSISTPLSTIQMWPRVIHTSHFTPGLKVIDLGGQICILS